MDSLYDIRDRYLHDITYISDYVNYLEEHFLTSIKLIENINIVTPTFSSNPSIDNLCNNNMIIQSEMFSYFQSVEAEMQLLDINNSILEGYDNSTSIIENDVVEYIINEIQKGEHDSEKLFHSAETQIEVMCIMFGDRNGYEHYNYLNDDPILIRELVSIAIEEAKRRKYKNLNTEYTCIGMSIKSLDLFETKNQINLYKQNFIQIMAYFDSCVFDMLRFCMENNFFEWLAYFDSVNIKTHEMASYGNFDSFRNNQIETFLKKCYVKDLLNILHNKFNGFFVANGNDIYPSLQEMIGRRNVHIHHNGIADKMYVSNFNLYGARIGDYLEINKDYFDKAVEATKQIITAISTIYDC